jgi:hypothetical protein
MISKDKMCKLIKNDITADNHIKWTTYVDTDSIAVYDRHCDAISYPTVTYDLTPEAKRMLDEIIDRRLDELKKKESKTTNETTKETKKENTMKNVLFLAPGYPYAKTVVTNQSKELDRKKIPYTVSVATNDVYIHTDAVHVEIIYMDPVKWTPDLFHKRDAVFGKKELVEQAKERFFRMGVFKPTGSLSKYIREIHSNNVDPTIVDVKPREIYIPEIKNVYFNDPVTVVMWEDGTKTVVKCQEGDVYSEEVGMALCIAKKSLGNMPNFNNVFKKWIPDKQVVRVPEYELSTLNEVEQSLAKNVMKKFKEALHGMP